MDLATAWAEAASVPAAAVSAAGAEDAAAGVVGEAVEVVVHYAVPVLAGGRCTCEDADLGKMLHVDCR